VSGPRLSNHAVSLTTAPDAAKGREVNSG
jgi:hypothetical protein